MRRSLILTALVAFATSAQTEELDCGTAYAVTIPDVFGCGIGLFIANEGCDPGGAIGEAITGAAADITSQVGFLLDVHCSTCAEGSCGCDDQPLVRTGETRGLDDVAYSCTACSEVGGAAVGLNHV